MESFGMKDGSQMKSTSTTFGLIRRGNASDTEKMKPHFFRVMLDFMLKDAKIYIPTEFAKKYRSRLGSHATLKVANGDTWEVELATDDDGLIWLVKGWEDFTKHHTLKQGDIVVFRLEQDSLFLVMVFDPTASEKKYNFKHVNEFERQFNDVKVEEGIDVGKEKGHREGQKNVGTGRIAEVDGKPRQVKNKKGGAEEKRKGELASPVETPNHPMGTKMRAMPEPRRDNAFTVGENPNFSITMSEYYMKHRFMCLPTNFVFEHMMPENRTMMVFGDEGLGSWPFSFAFYPRSGHGRGLDRARLMARGPLSSGTALSNQGMFAGLSSSPMAK